MNQKDKIESLKKKHNIKSGTSSIQPDKVKRMNHSNGVIDSKLNDKIISNNTSLNRNQNRSQSLQKNSIFQRNKSLGNRISSKLGVGVDQEEINSTASDSGILDNTAKNLVDDTTRAVVSVVKNFLKAKLISILITISIPVIFVLLFITIIMVVFMSLGIVEVEGFDIIGDSSGSSGSVYYPSLDGEYTSVTTNVSHWIPIGSSQTTDIDGVLYASDTPQVNTITSSFGSNEEFRTSTHGGIDFGNGGNGPGVINIIATKSGTVIYPTSDSQTSFEDNGYYGNTDGGGFGNYVMIKHSDQTTTVYAHLAMNSITVMAGDSVSQGQVIGKMGHSGSSTGTHLHFEVRLNGERQNPMNYINPSIPRPS